MMNGNPRRQVKPMNRTVTESYCITFEVKVNSSDQPEIDGGWSVHGRFTTHVSGTARSCGEKFAVFRNGAQP